MSKYIPLEDMSVLYRHYTHFYGAPYWDVYGSLVFKPHETYLERYKNKLCFYTRFEDFFTMLTMQQMNDWDACVGKYNKEKK